VVVAKGPYGNCAKCQGRCRFDGGPDTKGKYRFTCVECGANTNRAPVPAEFESEYVDRLIDCGNRMYTLIAGPDDRMERIEPLSGWRALVALRREDSDDGS
jgi:hypothetical protein